jgi:hypothetical protein
MNGAPRCSVTPSGDASKASLSEIGVSGSIRRSPRNEPNLEASVHVSAGPAAAVTETTACRRET